jgi:cation diffusion facilitator CzcD-associated flavoprotein CzcO
VEPDTDTVIVGASAAGLATAACLQRAAVPFVLLEQGAQVAGAWRTRYDRLHLHTSKGLSYGEIAIDLSEHGAHAAICVRGPVNVVPRDFLGLPIVAWSLALNLLPLRVADAIGTLVSRIVFGRLEPLGLRRPPYGPMSQIHRRARIPLLDVGTVARIRRGEIDVLPAIESFTPHGARFSGGAERAFDAVVLATGYRPALETFLEPAASVLDEEGVPARSGAETLPGLYFCGFHVTATGVLREISREAQRIARSIASKQVA